MKDDNMKNQEAEMDDELRPEYDLTRLLKEGVRGKYAERYREGTNIVLLDDDVAAIFRTSEEVNNALRTLGKLIQQHAHTDLTKPSA